MKIRGRWVLGVGTALLVVLGACSREKAAPKQELAQSAVTASAVTNSPVMQRLAAIAEHCRVNLRHSIISNCKNGEKQSLIRDYNTGKLSRLESLPVLVTALEGSDEKLRVAASKTLEGAFRNNLGKVAAGDVPKALARRLVNLVPKLDARQALQVVPAVVHSAVLANETPSLFEMLDQQEASLRAAAYVHLMRYGDAALLRKVESLVKEQDEKVAASAIEALRRMSNRDEAEQQRVCELVRPWVEDERGMVAGKAATISVMCGGEQAGAVVDEVEKRYGEKRLPGLLLRGMDQLCLNRRGARYGSPEQCERARSLLERVLNDSSQGDDTRTFALLSLGLQFPDERTEQLANKYTKNSSRRLATSAKRVAKSVEVRRERVRQGADVSARSHKKPYSATKSAGAGVAAQP